MKLRVGRAAAGVVAGGVVSMVSSAALAQASANSPSTAASESTAAPGGENQLAEIVVTARRSSESMLSVPVAVSAVSADTLVRNNVTDLSAISTIVPFVNIQKAPAGTGGLFQIRGIGSPIGDPGVQQTVLVNIDNVLINRGRIVNQALFDMQQVEVLKGPQALFFGRNSTAGVVSVTTASPGEQLAGYIRGGYEFIANERYVDFAGDIPVTPTLAVRLAGHFSGTDGFIRNTAQPEANPFAPAFPLTGPSNSMRDPGHDADGRVTVNWQPVSAFSALFKFTQAHDTNGGEASLYETYCKPGIAHPTDFGVPDLQNDCSFNRTLAINAFPAALTQNMPNSNGGVEGGKVDSSIASAALHYTSDEFSVDSVTGYYHLQNHSTAVFDMTSFSNIFTSFDERASSVSEELRVTSAFHGPLNFVGGGYVGRDSDALEDASFLAFLGPDPVTGNYYTNLYEYDVNTYAKSVFGQVRLRIRDDLELDGGARYTHERKNSNDGLVYVHSLLAFAFRPENEPFIRTYDDHNVSPEVTLTWHPADSQTLYAAYKTGYKSGGFSYPQVQTVTTTEANTTLKPEKSKGGEVGYKAYLLDRTLRLEVTAYRYTFSDLQVSSFDAPTLSFVTGNAAESRTSGVELQATAQPTHGLVVDGSVGYNNAKYTSFPTGPCYAGQTTAQGCVDGAQNLGNTTLPRAPHWQGTLNANYEWDMSHGLKLDFNGRATYVGSYNAQDNHDPFTVQTQYWEFDAGTTLATQDDTWSLGVIGKNLTNKYVDILSLDKARGQPGEYNAVPGRPRQVIIQVGYRF